MSAERIKELKSLIDYHENEAEIMRHIGCREFAELNCQRAKEFKIHLMLND